MKKLLSTNYSSGAFNFAILVLRLGVGILMMHHGYQKLTNFNGTVDYFPNFLGLSKSVSLSLDIFAEFFCSMFLILGLFTRLAVIPIMIAMGVALVHAHDLDVFGKGELASHYLIAYVVLLFVGPGRVSVDAMIGK
jgi:putative oxidoreductase